MECMETILHFDKLFYHFSHSDVNVKKNIKGRKYRMRRENINSRFVRGDRERKRRNCFLFEFNFEKFIIFCSPDCAVPCI